jgi:Domain of unknown function (DUF4405)
MTRNQAIFAFDAMMLVGFCAVESVRLAGIAFHEWLGILLIVVFVVHLLLSWNWVSAQTKYLMRGVARDRIGYFLNLAFFVVAVIAMFTGIAISEAVLPAIGVIVPRNNFWLKLHSVAANVMILLCGFHIALNWDWILKTVSHVKRSI